MRKVNTRLEGENSQNLLKPEVIIDIAAHHFIRLDDLLYFVVDEKVERVDMLLYQTLDF
jgi:hypothetical protein